MAKNLRPGPGGNPGHFKHGLTKFNKLDWSDPEQVKAFCVDGLDEDENEILRFYLRTLALDDNLDLSSFEMQRIALAMLALDRGDKWFFANREDKDWNEFQIELQKFLGGKEKLVIETMQKAKREKKSSKSLWDQLDDPNFKNIEVKADGEIQGVEYKFEWKKKKKPKFLEVVVNDDGDSESESGESEETEETQNN